jgi:hypothetical protein
MEGLGYSEPDRPGLQDLAVAIGVASLPAGGTEIRADGMAVWLDPKPLRDTRTGKRLRVTVAGGCPGNDIGAVDVRRADGADHDLGTRLLPAASPTLALICDYSGSYDDPARHLVRIRRLDATAAGRLARSVGRLPLGHPVDEVMHCPYSDGMATVIAISYRGRPDVDLWQDRNGCAFITNGAIVARIASETTLTPAAHPKA